MGNKSLEKEQFKKWKVKFDEKRKIERFNYLKPLAITAVIITVIFITIYYSLTGEYKFIGQETKVIQAEVISTEMVHHWMGYFKQRVDYTFEINNKKYNGTSVIDKRIGKRSVGEAIKIKISLENPKKSKIVGHY